MVQSIQLVLQRMQMIDFHVSVPRQTQSHDPNVYNSYCQSMLVYRSALKDSLLCISLLCCLCCVSVLLFVVHGATWLTVDVACL